VVDKTIVCDAIRAAWIADRDWATIRREAIANVRVIVSNTGDMGFRLDERDTAALLSDEEQVPRSYPAKLLVLLHARWRERPDDGVSIFPCELVANNGDTLREIVLGLAEQWSLPAAFVDYVRRRCVWVNSLVDRIVSEPIDPVGAVAEPYALWAIERREGMELPCTHESIVLTDDLQTHERLKLFFLTSVTVGSRSSGSPSSDRSPKRCSMRCTMRGCAPTSRPFGKRKSCRYSRRWVCAVALKTTSPASASGSAIRISTIALRTSRKTMWRR
jgi:hypothetical protein